MKSKPTKRAPVESVVHSAKVGDRVRLMVDIYDDGDGACPPGYIARKGEEVIVRKIWLSGKGGVRAHLSHEHITDNAFHAYGTEFELL